MVAPRLFAFIWISSFSVVLLAWRSVCASLRCGNRCFRNGQRKQIIRTRLLLETSSDYIGLVPVVGVEPTRVISTRDFEFLSSSSIWCHPVISSDIWFPLCKGKIHASTNNNLKYPRFFDAFFLYSVFSVWTAQMEIGGMFRRDAGQNAPLLRHKTKGKSRIMNQNQAKEYYKKLFVNYPDVLSVEEATTLLGFKSQTAIIRRIHQHRIRCLKVGRSFMIPKEYLIDYLLDS